MASTRTPAKRVLAVIRLSDETDESTSPERQRALITNWAEANGYVLAGEAEDLDISGGMRPFERPSLGEWLKTPDRFDVLACWKLDRLTRRALHFAEMLEWCESRGKTIVSVTEGFDVSTSMGKMFARIIAAFAEGELDVITERVRASHEKLRQDGRYAGAPLPFGYVAGELSTGGKTLVQDVEYAEILRRMLKDVSEGVSTHEIARKLNEQSVMTWGDRRYVLRGKPPEERQHWTPDVIQQIVKNPAVAGYKTQRLKTEDGRYRKAHAIVIDDDGNPVMATAEPIVSPAEWQSAIKSLSSRAAKGDRMARTESMLQGVLKCGGCEHNVYQHRSRHTVGGVEKIYAYYACQSRRKERECATPVRVPVDETEADAVDALLALLGNVEITRTEHDPGEDYSAQLAEAQSILDTLEDDFLAGKYKGEEAARRYHRMHSKQSAKIDRLAALPHRPATTRQVGTGETYAERWGRLERLERRDFLLSQGITFRAYAPGTLRRASLLGTAELNTKPVVLAEVPEPLLALSPRGDGSVRFSLDPGTRMGSEQ
ncbi:recombinase family protein [Streptomyces sp. NBC_01764]|uniref:recombinase family protein n=1 Tax=Streptomyces sp. NBC_01764 TaxID=2975935 RepID=UPI00225B6969|nr:recombinase family protein [Streptomyces sp. NBC_01764]MCX4400645.1 recombinase family protein [Streptomyces sp. NBC_01764]